LFNVLFVNIQYLFVFTRIAIISYTPLIAESPLLNVENRDDWDEVPTSPVQSHSHQFRNTRH